MILTILIYFFSVYVKRNNKPPMHINIKLTKYVLNYHKGIFFDAWLFVFFKQDKRSVIHCKIYSSVPIFTSVPMGTQFTFVSCHYSLLFICSIAAQRLPFIANIFQIHYYADNLNRCFRTN